MQKPLEIQFRDLSRSEALESEIRDKVAKLEQFYPHITACHVVVEVPHKHSQHGRVFVVKVDINVPGGEIVVSNESGEDPHVAVRDAFDAAQRKLKDYARRQRGDVKSH